MRPGSASTEASPVVPGMTTRTLVAAWAWVHSLSLAWPEAREPMPKATTSAATTAAATPASLRPRRGAVGSDGMRLSGNDGAFATAALFAAVHDAEDDGDEDQ